MTKFDLAKTTISILSPSHRQIVWSVSLLGAPERNLKKHPPTLDEDQPPDTLRDLRGVLYGLRVRIMKVYINQKVW